MVKIFEKFNSFKNKKKEFLLENNIKEIEDFISREKQNSK